MERSVWKLLLVGVGVAGGGTLAAGCGAGVTEPPPSPPSRAPYETRRPPQIESSRTGKKPRPPRIKSRFPGRPTATPSSRGSSGQRRRDDQEGGRRARKTGRAQGRDQPRGRTRGNPDTDQKPHGRRAKDFPDRPITLSLYDPQDAPILKARYRPGEGVHYQIAPGKSQGQTPATTSTSKPAGDPLTRGGVTERDQAFAAWAETHGKSMLRYVEADLERHGRLWFGVTRDVKSEEVRPLTTSLLRRCESFPRGARGHRSRPPRADPARPPGTRWRCALGTIVVNPGSRPNRRGKIQCRSGAIKTTRVPCSSSSPRARAAATCRRRDHFQHFANFSAGAPRRDVEAGVGEALPPREAVSPDQMEPQFRDAASKIQPHERSEIAQDLLDELQQRGSPRRWLQRMLGLGRPTRAGQRRRRRQARRVLAAEPPRGVPAGDGRQAVPRPLAEQAAGRRPGRRDRGKLMNRATTVETTPPAGWQRTIRPRLDHQLEETLSCLDDRIRRLRPGRRRDRARARTRAETR